MGRVGFLPEHFRFPSWMTAAGFLDIHGRLLGMPASARRQRGAELLAQVGLADRASTRLGDFSKGMSQRIGLAHALLNEPEVVFLDEPTSGLDPLGRREVRDLIRSLRSAGVTVFLNSHLLSEVEAVCDRVAIVKRGRVVRLGSLHDLTSGNLEVNLRADGLDADMIKGLAQWGKVVSWDADRVTLALGAEETIPLVVEWLIGNGASIYELSPKRFSLEELFASVMEEGQG